MKPALSGAAADLAVSPTTIAFYWFYLPVYPLIDAWGPGRLGVHGLAHARARRAAVATPEARVEAQPYLMVRPDNRIVSARTATIL